MQNPLKRKVQVWIHRGDGAALEVLLLRLKPERGGYWQPVTGGVDGGESFAAGALREAQEESGLDFGREAPRALGYEFKYEAKGREIEEHVFGLAAPLGDHSIRLDPREHVESRWVSVAEAPSWLKHASNVTGLGHLVAEQAGKSKGAKGAKT